MAAAAAALRACGARLAGGGDEQPDTGRLEMAQEAVVRALAQRISQLPAAMDDRALEALVGRSFRIRAISYTTRQIAGYALAASGAAHEAAGVAAVQPGRSAAGDGRHRAGTARRLAPLPRAPPCCTAICRTACQLTLGVVPEQHPRGGRAGHRGVHRAAG